MLHRNEKELSLFRTALKRGRIYALAVSAIALVLTLYGAEFWIFIKLFAWVRKAIFS